MVKHNNQLVNNHFRKDWDKRVRTWFNQPARKQRRRQVRKEKARAIYPRPVTGLLRPLVHCPTSRYNLKVRLGRGFSLQELKAAQITPREAHSVGIAIDYRRSNKSVESVNLNVQRLKVYKSKLVLFPKDRKIPKSKRKETEVKPTAAVDLQSVVQQTKNFPLNLPDHKEASVRITAQMRQVSAHRTMRRQHKLEWGVGHAIRKARKASTTGQAPAKKEAD
eukprot:TRINITY_DN7318_c0_g2_i4.p1 TRINITY_DN7318_c0_g2~~TRINITY_DN7318_c0_g2_i4.p1  ORF type:complete len:221 (-),score=30.26 TRINITY_DN7318_c0_g2_i4:52-714(-)